MKVYAVLFLFFGVYLTVCIWIFLIITDSVRKISSHGFLQAKQEFIKTVDRHFIMLIENKPVPEEEILLLCRQLKNKKMKRYLLQRFIFFADRIGNKERIKEYFKTALTFFQDMLKREKSLHYSEKSYRLMLLGEFRQDSEEINAYLLSFLGDESFDVRNNALRALSLIGNSDCFHKGLMIACSSEKYFNSRHISDMTGSFEGNTGELMKLMMENFSSGPDSYCYQVIVYLADHSGADSAEFVLDHLQNHPENKEIVIAGLKYFGVSKVHDKKAYERVKEYIWKMLSVEDAEIRAVLVKLAQIYFYRDWSMIRRLLGEGFLRSKDWHVRRNSAAALVKIGLEKERLMSFMPIDDSYAREALIYAMLEAGIAVYSELLGTGGGWNGAVV